MLLVGYLIDRKRKLTTINSYVSVIKSVLRQDRFRVSEDRYVIKSLIKTCKYRCESVFIRLPIQKELLELILRKVDSVYLGEDNPQPYLARSFHKIAKNYTIYIN